MLKIMTLNGLSTFGRKCGKMSVPNLKALDGCSDCQIYISRPKDAIAIVQKIKKTKGSYYSNKANSYITRIEERKTKEAAKKMK